MRRAVSGTHPGPNRKLVNAQAALGYFFHADPRGGSKKSADLRLIVNTVTMP